MKNFYVYMFIRKDTNEIFYIGKGKGNRYLDIKSNRNKYFKRICEKCGYESYIYKNDLTEDEAFELEKSLIAEYRSKGLAKANFHEGGRGGNVYVYDGEKRKQKMIEKCRLKSSGENNPMYGRSWKENKTDEDIKTHNENVSKGLKKRYENENHRKLTGQRSKERWHKNDGFREKYRKNNSRRVYMYDLEMNLLKTFDSLYDALDFLKIKGHTTLLKAISLNKPYKNYLWKREDLKGVETIESAQ